MTNQECVRCLEDIKILFVRGSEECSGEALKLHNQYISALKMAIEALKNKPDYDILFLCDGKACGEDHDCMECKHTLDICHAKNFHYNDALFDKNYYLEEDSDGKTN